MGKSSATATSSYSLVDLLLLGVTVVWGINSPLVKYALSGFTPLSFNGIRFVVCTVTLFVFLWAFERDLRIRREDFGRMLFAGFLGNFVYQLAFIKGINLSLAGNTAFVLATMPVSTALLARLARLEFPSRRAWAGMAVALAGVMMVSVGGGKEFSLASKTLRGDAITFAGTFGWSWYTVLIKPLLRRYSSLKVTAWTMLTGTVFLAAASVPELRAQDWTKVGAGHWAALVFSGSMAITGAYIIWNWGLGKLGMARTAAYQNLSPIWAGITGWLWLGEPWNWLRLTGAIAVLVGLAVVRNIGIDAALRLLRGAGESGRAAKGAIAATDAEAGAGAAAGAGTGAGPTGVSRGR